MIIVHGDPGDPHRDRDQPQLNSAAAFGARWPMIHDRDVDGECRASASFVDVPNAAHMAAALLYTLKTLQASSTGAVSCSVHHAFAWPRCSAVSVPARLLWPAARHHRELRTGGAAAQWRDVGVRPLVLVLLFRPTGISGRASKGAA